MFLVHYHLYLNHKLDKKKKDIDNIVEKVKEYQDECTLIEKEIKEYENMVRILQ